MTDTKPLPAKLENPPFSAEAEQHAIVRIVANGEAEITQMLLPEDFHEPVYREIFEATKKLYEEEIEIDIVSLHDRLKGSRTLASDSSFLAKLLITISPTASVKNIVHTLKRHRAAREMLSIHPHAEALTRDGRIDEVPSALTNFSQTLADLLPRDSAIDKEALITELTTDIATLPTGFLAIDSLLNGGLAPGDMMIIAARPATGKTSLATHLTAEFLKRGIETCFISMEMSQRLIISRMLCSYHQVTFPDIRLRAAELVNAVKTDLHLQTGVHELSAIQTEVLATPAKVILIDYLSLITMQSKEGRFVQIGDISRAIKRLAIQANKPIIVMHQLSREVEKDKTNREPQLSDLYGAGENDPDIVSFLWDPNAKDELAAATKSEKEAKESVKDAADFFGAPNPNKRPDGKRELHWIIRKNRNGPTGRCRLLFVPDKFTMQEDSEVLKIRPYGGRSDALPF